MLHFKLFSLLLTAVVALFAFRQIQSLIARFQMQRARVRPNPRPPGTVRLRRDPRSGIYYPEN